MADTVCTLLQAVNQQRQRHGLTPSLLLTRVRGGWCVWFAPEDYFWHPSLTGIQDDLRHLLDDR